MAALPLAQRAARGRQALLTGVVINAVLALLKLTTGYLGHSDALIADGIESALDVFSSSMIWGALKYAERPPDSTHPYGHGKMESLAAVGGALLLLLAGLFVAENSVREILIGAANRPLPAPFTLLVLLVVILVKEALFRMTDCRSREVESLAVRSDAWHHRSDALTSLSAVIGISACLIGGPTWISADDWAALFSCGIIVFNGARIFRGALGEILDEQAPREVIEKIMQSACKVEGVENIEKCRVRKSGLTFIADIHVRVLGDVTVTESHSIAHNVKDALLQGGYHLSDVTVHVEPA